MRKFICLALLLYSMLSFGQGKKKNIEGKGLQVALVYANQDRPAFDKYISTVASTLNLTSSINPKTHIGLATTFGLRTGKTEIEAGAGLVMGLKLSAGSTNQSDVVSLSTKTFDIHFGYNNYIGGPFFIGFDFGVINNGGKFQHTGNSGTMFESTPSSSSPFKGYCFNLRPKAGFFFPFKSGEYSGLKLTAFYDYGLTKYEFYKNDIFDIRLKNYSGETKSAYKGLGFQLGLVIAMDK
ncbi:MAG: hypothetical protein J0M10_04945 [Chitinophagales bacterium]|nr:hypothetical protein [Chitinophagales bacterium]